jgi:uncharacterized membrane protein YbhN (UPF0104 family)
MRRAQAPSGSSRTSEGPAADPVQRQRGWSRKKVWSALVAILAVSLAAFLLYRTLSRYSLDELIASVSAVPMQRLLAAGGFAAVSYLCLTGFDYLALRYVGRPLPYRKAALASFTSLSLGHNIGFAALSSGAIRYRFYSRWGLRPGEIAKVILFCGLTVGLGLIILGGAALLIRSELAAEITGLSRPAVLGMGALCLALASTYLALAAFVQRSLTFWSWSLEIPAFPIAMAQVVIGPLNFALVAACLHQALAAVADIAYLGVASVYVIANATALLTHVPGGLGVIESVVIYLLPQTNLIGPLLVFRFVYFLVPLAIGGTLLVTTEIVLRSRGKDGAPPEVPDATA